MEPECRQRASAESSRFGSHDFPLQRPMQAHPSDVRRIETALLFLMRAAYCLCRLKIGGRPLPSPGGRARPIAYSLIAPAPPRPLTGQLALSSEEPSTARAWAETHRLPALRLERSLPWPGPRSFLSYCPAVRSTRPWGRLAASTARARWWAICARPLNYGHVLLPGNTVQGLYASRDVRRTASRYRLPEIPETRNLESYRRGRLRSS